MAQTTPRYGLTLPDGSDRVNVGDLNENFRIIDSNLGADVTGEITDEIKMFYHGEGSSIGTKTFSIPDLNKYKFFICMVWADNTATGILPNLWGVADAPANTTKQTGIDVMTYPHIGSHDPSAYNFGCSFTLNYEKKTLTVSRISYGGFAASVLGVAVYGVKKTIKNG